MQALRQAVQQGSPLVVVRAQHIQQLLDTLKTLQSLLGCQVTSDSLLLLAQGNASCPVTCMLVCSAYSELQVPLNACMTVAIS